MDLNRDDVRRELREIDAEHEAALRSTAELVDRLYQDDHPEQLRWDALAGGANRSTWLRVGGVAVLTSAVLAACGDGGDGASPTTATPPTTAQPLAPGDLTVLRFTASVEQVAVTAYDRLVPLVTSPAGPAVKLFGNHHKDHLSLLNSVIRSGGGTQVEAPNAAVQARFQPRLDALRGEGDALVLALDLEAAMTATYLATFDDLQRANLGYTAMSIGATEYRHAQLLASALGREVPGSRNGFLTEELAIAPNAV